MINWAALSGELGEAAQRRERRMLHGIVIGSAIIQTVGYGGFVWFLYELALAWLRLDGYLP